MTKSRYLISLACLSLLSSQACAVAGWTSDAMVTELNPTTSGRFLVRLEAASNPSGCKDKHWFYRDYTGTGADHLFHALLGAITSGKQVRVYVTGSCDINGYSEISSASILR